MIASSLRHRCRKYFTVKILRHCNQRKGSASEVRKKWFVSMKCTKPTSNTELLFFLRNLQFPFFCYQFNCSKRPENPAISGLLCCFVQNRDFGYMVESILCKYLCCIMNPWDFRFPFVRNSYIGAFTSEINGQIWTVDFLHGNSQGVS